MFDIILIFVRVRKTSTAILLILGYNTMDKAQKKKQAASNPVIIIIIMRVNEGPRILHKHVEWWSQRQVFGDVCW